MKIKSILFALLAYLLFHCTLPQDPAKKPFFASVHFTSFDGVEPGQINEVKAGVEIKVGYYLLLPNFIDSIKISIISFKKDVEAEYKIESPWDGDSLTTLVTFPKPGTKTGVITCYKNNGSVNSDTLVFIVTYPAGNHPPLWTPDTLKLLSMEGLSTNQNLAPYTKDPDNNPISFDISLPTTDFTAKDSIVTVSSFLNAGNYYLKVIISDGELEDTGIVLWTVFTMQSQHAVIQNDSAKTVSDSQIVINVLGNDFISSGTMVLSSVTQPDHGIATIKDNKVMYIPASGFAGVVTFDYIVNAMDTGHIIITVVSKTTTPSTDHSPPVMQLKIPETDSISVNESSATVSVEIRDESGIDTVLASFGMVNLQTSASASIYSITVTNLIPNHYNTLTFIARDASGNNNLDTLFVTIKYDPTMSDETGPVIKQISGPSSGAIVTDPLVTIVNSITDPSDIDSVFYRLNNGPIKMLTAVSGKTDQFSLTESVVRENLDTIQITAVDKSSKRNRSIQTIILNYVIPPVITVQPVSQTVCSGSPVTFTITATGTAPLTYQWRKGTGTNTSDITGATNSSYNFTPNASDNGAVFTCSVANGSTKNVISEACTLVVNVGPTKPTAVASPATICAGDSTVLSVSVGTLASGTSWKWYTSTSSTTPLTLTKVCPSESKWYFVKGVGGTCGDSPFDSVYITVNTRSVVPTEIITSTAAVCSGSDITLSLNGGTLGTRATWQWFTDASCTQPASGTPNADGSQIVVKPTSTTTYYVKAVGACNATSVISKSVIVNTPSTAPSGITSATMSVCPGSQITLSVTGGSLGTGASWKWYTNATCTQVAFGTPNINGSQFTVSLLSQITFYVRAEGPCNITPAASATITVNSPPVIVSPLSDQDICSPGQSASLSIIATGSTPLSYEWRTVDGTLLGRSQTDYFPTETVGSTSLYCIVTDVNGCTSRSNTAKVTVHQATVITNQPESKGGYQPYTITDTIKANGDGLNYEWQCQSLDDYQWRVMGAGSTISIVLGDMPGYSTYLNTFVTTKIPVRVKITNQFGCEIFSEIVEYSVMWGI